MSLWDSLMQWLRAWRVDFLMLLHTQIVHTERMEIKDALSYLRMLVYKDDISFRRIVNVPKRNIGKKRMAFLEQYAKDNRCTLYMALNENLEENAIPSEVVTMDVNDYDDFLESRRIKMAKLVEKYYKSL